MSEPTKSDRETAPSTELDGERAPDAPAKPPREIGGRPSGLDPTRYGDWEKDGRCIDF